MQFWCQFWRCKSRGTRAGHERVWSLTVFALNPKLCHISFHIQSLPYRRGQMNMIIWQESSKSCSKSTQDKLKQISWPMMIWRLLSKSWWMISLLSACDRNGMVVVRAQYRGKLGPTQRALHLHSCGHNAGSRERGRNFEISLWSWLDRQLWSWLPTVGRCVRCEWRRGHTRESLRGQWLTWGNYSEG